MIARVPARPSELHQRLLVAFLALAALCATIVAWRANVILAYGDAESHLNIAKRVIDSITPGLAQLGGIWLPLPHLAMVPLVAIEPLYRTGLAGSIVSGIAFVVSGVYVYKIARLLTGSNSAALLASLVFGLNPNILYLQATPMTELPLIACFMLSTYYFARFVYDDQNTILLILAALAGCLATLMRYDGWFLVIIEGVALVMLYGARRWDWARLEGKGILFGTLGFFGIGLWLLWDLVILGDPLYFTNSAFSAKSQQNGWLARGQLPAYHDLGVSLSYYTVTAAINSGLIVFGLGALGLAAYLVFRPDWKKVCVALVLMAPFIFNVVTLFLGQSIILIPELTPSSYVNTLFNVRYGVLMVPSIAIMTGYLFRARLLPARLVIVALVALNLASFAVGYTPVITLDDGLHGLSHSYKPDAEGWLAREYDGGLVAMDDFSKTISIVRSGIPMQNMIYIGNKPYWEEALNQPERTVRWIVIQKDDALYANFLGDPVREGNLYKYFEKAYTSPDVLIFKRNTVPATP